jgi:hypothetical protein
VAGFPVLFDGFLGDTAEDVEVRHLSE